MIYIDITGRCGNQLFQYAFGRKLSILNDDNNLILDFFHTERIRKEKNDNSFCETINNFNVLPYASKIDNGNNIDLYGSKEQKRLYKKYWNVRKLSPHIPFINLLQKHQDKMQKNGIYKEDECAFVPQKSKNENIFVRGYFEDPMYFDDIRNILLEEFTPIFPRKENNKKLYEIIDNNESVCVSFRVWEDIADDKEQLIRRDVCSKEYYLKAIETMHKKIPNAVFIVFSNNIEWVKKNIHFDCPVYFEDGDDEVWEKLRLMYSCKHFIMSTSTFCWWAQYLSRNNGKIVVSPSKWCLDDKKPNKLLMKEWVKIPIR